MSDLSYNLTDKQLSSVHEALKEKGFDATAPSGTMTHDGVTIAYNMTPMNGLTKVDLTIAHHGLLEPKPLVISKIQKLFAAIPQT